MKKFFALTALALASSVALTSCSKDDDSSDSNNDDCITCSISQAGVTLSSEVCDNGDGTITFTVNGTAPQTITADYDTYVAAAEAGGYSCN